MSRLCILSTISAVVMKIRVPTVTRLSNDRYIPIWISIPAISPVLQRSFFSILSTSASAATDMRMSFMVVSSRMRALSSVISTIP